MYFVSLGFLIFLIRSIILFIGQKFIPTSDERRQNWEERKKRRCINCGFTGGMTNYLDTNKGQAILIILLLFLLLPGIIFWLVVRGKKICPKCQSLNTTLI
jgi:ribosomal protein S27AE